MDTPRRPGARDESPDPLSELDRGQGQDSHTSFLTSSALRRVTRSQRSDSLYSLDQRSRIHASRFSVSPRKQTFHLDVGDYESPKKIRVTVETENDGDSTGSNSAGSVGHAQVAPITEERVKRRLFRAPSQTPAPSLIVPSLPPPATTSTRRRQRSSSPTKSSAAPSANRSRKSISQSVATRTTTVPLRGLSDDEEDELDTTIHTLTTVIPLSSGTPKPKRGRPRRSGTPMPDKIVRRTLASSPQSEVTPAAPEPTPAKGGRKPRAATPKIEINDNASTADELASIDATPILQSPDKRASLAASRATPRGSNTPGAAHTPKTARASRSSVTPSRITASAKSGYSSGAESTTSSFRVSKRGRGRPRRQAMAPDDMAAIAEERDEQVTAERRPGPAQLPEQLPEPGQGGAGDEYYGAASPDPFLDLFEDAEPVPRPTYSAEHRVLVSPAHTSLSSVDLINVQTPAAENNLHEYEYRDATSPLDLLRSQPDYSPESQGAQHANEDDLIHFSSAPSPFVQEQSATHIDLHSEAGPEAGPEAQNDNENHRVPDLVTQSPAPPHSRVLPQEQSAVPLTALPQSEVTAASSDSDVDPVHFSDGGLGSESHHGFYHGFDDRHDYVAESELGVGSEAYSESDRAGSNTPGGLTLGQNTISKGEDFSMIGLESLQSSFQLSRGPLPEMGDVTSRIVNHSLDAIRQDHVATNGNDSRHDGASYLDFLTADSSPSSAPSVVSAHRSPLLPGNRRASATKPTKPAVQTPPRKILSPIKKAIPLAKILGRKSVAPPLQTVVGEASLVHGEENANDKVNDKADPSTNDTVTGGNKQVNDGVGEPSLQYNDSFSEIPDAVLDAAAVVHDNDTEYFSQQQAELTGGVAAPPVMHTAVDTAANGSPVPSLPLSSPFPSSPAASQSGRTLSRHRQTVTSGAASLAPGTAPVDYTPSPLRHAVTTGPPDLATVTAPHSEAVHEPKSQHQTEPSPHSNQQVTAGADATLAEYTAESSPTRGQVVTPDRAALVEYTTEPVSSPPDQTNSRLQVPSEGFRPSLSPIVRAGRVLQSVTSSPPTPKDEQILRSPFRGAAIASSPVPPVAPAAHLARPEKLDEREDDHEDSEFESESESEHEPPKYELVEAQVQREASISVAPSEASFHSDSEDDFNGEDEEDSASEHEPAELQEDQDQGQDQDQEQEPQPEPQHVRHVATESSPPPASSFRAWTMGRLAMEGGRIESPYLRRNDSPPSAVNPTARSVADTGSPVSSPSHIITPTPALRPVAKPSPKRTADDAGLDIDAGRGKKEAASTELPSFRKRARLNAVVPAGLSGQSHMRQSTTAATKSATSSSARSPLSSQSHRDRSNSSRLSANSRATPLRATRTVQPAPANGIFAENTADAGSTGRTWRSLVSGENGIVGSISNFASKLISRIPNGENTHEQSPQSLQPQPEERTVAQPEQAIHPFFGGAQRESEQQRELEVEREMELLEREAREQERERAVAETSTLPEMRSASFGSGSGPGSGSGSRTRPRQRIPDPPHSDSSSTHYGSDAIQSMINDISLEGRDATTDVSALHGSGVYQREPEDQYENEQGHHPEQEHEPKQQQQQKHDEYDNEPAPMDINSVHEPELQYDEPEPMDINIAPSATNPAQSSYHGQSQSQPQSQADWDNDEVDIWAVEAERTTRISTMPSGMTTQTVPVFPAPVLSAPPVTVRALSPALSYRSTPLSPVEEVQSSSVARPLSVLRSTPPARPRRRPQPADAALQTGNLQQPLHSGKASVPANNAATARSRFLDEFFSSPAALPQELAPTKEADVRFNEQARQHTMLERERRRLGGASHRQEAVDNATTPTSAPAPAPSQAGEAQARVAGPTMSGPNNGSSRGSQARESFDLGRPLSMAASSSPAALASSPSRVGPPQNSSLGYFSRQMEVIANTPEGRSLANFFDHTYPEADEQREPLQPEQGESSPPRVSQLSGEEVTPHNHSSAGDDIESSFVTPDLRPLPSRSASPTKSCIRPRTKPKVPGRVVVIREGDASRGIPERVTYGEEAMQDRARNNTIEQRFAEHFGLDEVASPTTTEEQGGMAQQPADNEYPGVSHASFRLDGFQSEPGHAVFHDAVPAVREEFGRPASITKMPERDWTTSDWIALNEVVHALRGSFVLAAPEAESRPAYQRKVGKYDISAEQTWYQYLEWVREHDDDESRYKRGSYVLLGKVVHTDMTAMLVKRWHLDIVDVFRLRSGRIWNEHFVLRRLFSLLLSEMHRGVYVPGS